MFSARSLRRNIKYVLATIFILPVAVGVSISLGKSWSLTVNVDHYDGNKPKLSIEINSSDLKSADDSMQTIVKPNKIENIQQSNQDSANPDLFPRSPENLSNHEKNNSIEPSTEEEMFKRPPGTI